MKNIIKRNKNDLAFIVGNGINRYKSTDDSLSWDSLLQRTMRTFSRVRR